MFMVHLNLLLVALIGGLVISSVPTASAYEADVAESNNTIAEAYELSLGTTDDFTLSTTLDVVDFYNVSLTAGNLFHLHIYSAPTTRLMLVVLDPIGTQIFADDQIWGYVCETMYIGSTGNHTIILTAMEHQDDSTTYSLELTTSFSTYVADAFENNNDPAHAAEIGLGGYLGLSASEIRDVDDWYNITLDIGLVLAVNLSTSREDYEFVVEIYDPLGDLVMSQNTWLYYEDYSLAYAYAYAQIDSLANYSIHVECTEGWNAAYNLSISINVALYVDDLYESNDQKADAKLLPAAGADALTASALYDPFDYYNISIPARTRAFITIETFDVNATLQFMVWEGNSGSGSYLSGVDSVEIVRVCETEKNLTLEIEAFSDDSILYNISIVFYTIPMPSLDWIGVKIGDILNYSVTLDYNDTGDVLNMTGIMTLEVLNIDLLSIYVNITLNTTMTGSPELANFIELPTSCLIDDLGNADYDKSSFEYIVGSAFSFENTDLASIGNIYNEGKSVLIEISNGDESAGYWVSLNYEFNATGILQNATQEQCVVSGGEVVSYYYLHVELIGENPPEDPGDPEDPDDPPEGGGGSETTPPTEDVDPEEDAPTLDGFPAFLWVAVAGFIGNALFRRSRLHA
jgi:hypothetical protein